MVRHSVSGFGDHLLPIYGFFVTWVGSVYVAPIPVLIKVPQSLLETCNFDQFKGAGNQLSKITTDALITDNSWYLYYPPGIWQGGFDT